MREDTSIIRRSKVHLGSDGAATRLSAYTAGGGLAGRTLGTASIEEGLVGGAGILQILAATASVGGIVGHHNGGTVERVKVEQVVKLSSTAVGAANAYLGGIAGESSGAIRDVISAPIFSWGLIDNKRIGGVTALTHGASSIERAFVGTSTAMVSGTYVGAIVGEKASGTECVAAGTGCVYYVSPWVNTNGPCGSGTCGSQYSASSNPAPANIFETNFGAGQFVHGSGAWMKKGTGPTTVVPRLQWEEVAVIDTTGGKLPTLSVPTIDSDKLGVYFPLSTTQHANVRATECKLNGKWYWEVEILEGLYEVEIGILKDTNSLPNGMLSFNQGADNAWVISDVGGGFVPYRGAGLDMTHNPDYEIVKFGTIQAQDAQPGDVIGVALDLASGTRTLTFYRNGVALAQRGNNTAPTMSGLPPSVNWCAAVGRMGTGANQHAHRVRFNFGAKPFRYPLPGGFLPYNFQQ